MPEPVQTPKPSIPATDKGPTAVKTAPTTNKNITVVDYSFLDTMPESTTTKTIMDYLTTKDIRPTQTEWTIVDVDAFRTLIANALTNITSVYTDKVAEDLGHAYLVDKALQYKKRCGDDTATVPTPQARPDEPDANDAYAQKLYHYHMKSYRLSRALDKEARLLITKKFPGSLVPLLCPISDSLPAHLTARQAFDHIEEDVRATPEGNLKHQELMHTLLTRGYTPGINSADMYFHQCEVDQYRIRAIGVADVPDKQIMVGAQIAF